MPDHRNELHGRNGGVCDGDERRPPDVERELRPALSAARRLEGFHALCAIAPSLVPLTGPAIVEFLPPNFYTPDPDGVAAIIVGAVAGYWPGELGHSEVVDLVAIEIEGARAASRFGIAAILGDDLVQWARWHGQPVKVVSPRQWLAKPEGAAAIVDWRRAPCMLQDVESLHFDDVTLARRVRDAFRRPPGLPRILIPG